MQTIEAATPSNRGLETTYHGAAPSYGFLEAGNTEVAGSGSVAFFSKPFPAAEISDPYMDKVFGVASVTSPLPTEESSAQANEPLPMQRRSPWRKRFATIGAGLALTGALAACSPTQSSSSSPTPAESSGHSLSSSSRPSASASHTSERHGGKPLTYATTTRDNYAGYGMVVGDGNIRSVAGSVIVPDARCNAAGANTLAFVGITSSNAAGEPADIEQAELYVDCPFLGSVPQYIAATEMYPNAPQQLAIAPISPDDRLYMSVTHTPGGKFDLSITDQTTGEHKERILNCPPGHSCTTNIAEGDVERLLGTDGNFLPLTTLGPVEFDNLQVTTTRGGVHGLPYYGRHSKLVRTTMEGGGRVLMSASPPNPDNGDFVVRQSR